VAAVNLNIAMQVVNRRLEGTRAAGLARRFLPGGALTLAGLTLAGYAMGLVRDKVLAHTFGAGAELDAYNAAFILPELALDVLVAGGLVAPFVPLFLGLRDEAAADAQRFARTVLGLACGAMVVVSVVLFAVAPATVAFIVPGFTDEQKDLYVGLFRVMCMTTPVFAASLVVGEVLVAERRFLWYGLAPVMYSAGIAAGALLFSSTLGIYAAAWGAVAGAIAQLGARLIGVRGTGFRPVPEFAFRTRGLGEFVRLMIPKMLSQPLEPLVFLFYTSLASSLTVGSVSSLSYARNFYGVPVSLIGMSFSIAAFPILSAAANAGDRAAFARSFRSTLMAIAVLSSLAGVALFVVSSLLIGMLLAGGAFDADDVARTALVLSVFAFAVPLESVMNLLARAIYATRNTLLPTLAALSGFVAIVVTASALVPTVGISAIPLSYAAGMGVRVVLLVVGLATRTRTIGSRTGMPTASLAAAASARPRRTPVLRPAMVFVATALVVAGTTYAADRALTSTNLAAAPVVTPWAPEFPIASHDVPPLPSSAPPTPERGAAGTHSPSPSRASGPFSMDLYQKGDFVGEDRDTWCVPAAMQTSINIMSTGSDTTKAFQARLFNLAYSLEPGNTGGADAAGWPEGLAKLGFGPFKIDQRTTMVDAVNAVAKAIRLTNRPGGLVVWYGWHSWVISGFQATADPAATDGYTVTGLYVEDVWYNRLSSIWGWSNPPDTLVKVSDLPKDYKRYKEWTRNPTRDGKYVFVAPVAER
jgi:putative peptidoglycan lipid II flippase